MSNEIIVETGTILESLNNKVDLDGGNYIGSGLETYINKNSKSGFNLFDTKIADHILEGEEAIGWGLQGTYVNKESYPDFYNKCLEQKMFGVESQVTLGESTLAMFVNSNGHQFYNIADKPYVDAFYETFGIADFYGIDEENERVFLPRNKYFHQFTDDISKVNKMVEAGLSNQIYGNSDTVQVPSSLKLLYYCVGNTVVNEAEIDVGGLVSQMELKANVSLDNVDKQAKALMSNMSLPSSKYINLTLGANGSTYTAPANGWFKFARQANANNQYAILINRTSKVENGMSTYQWGTIACSIPAKKGDSVEIAYNAAGELYGFMFIYAEGEQ